MKPFLRKLLAASAVVAVAAPAAYAAHSWENYHWARTSNPLKLTVNTRITAAWNASVTTAVADWDASPILQLTQQVAAAARGGKPKPTPSPTCNPIAGQVLVCNGAYGSNGWLGIASIWLTNGHISQATTKLNDTYFNTVQYNTPPWRALVACQEIGHDFGLGHVNEDFNPPNTGSCMDYTNDPDGGGTYGPSNEHPNQHDFDQLALIYGHLDPFNSSSTQSSQSAQSSAPTDFGIRDFTRPPQADAEEVSESGDSPAEWGTPTHYDSRGRPDRFEMNLGNGRKKVTHVFWTLEHQHRDH